MPVLIEACLNGARTAVEHPAIPRTPGELAAEAREAVVAGARVLHLHPYDDAGETLAAEPCRAAIQAVRAACPGIPISLSTSAEIEPDPRRRLELIEGWTEQPDLVTANQGEAGIVDVCRLLVGRGVGIEAGLLSLGDAEMFTRAGIAGSCVRVLVEPMDAEPDAAVAQAAAMEQVLLDAAIPLEQVHHGDMLATWHVMARAFARGYGTRAGLEDSTVLPDGRLAPGNGALVREAVRMLSSSPSQSH